jgi:hypothetical protein
MGNFLLPAYQKRVPLTSNMLKPKVISQVLRQASTNGINTALYVYSTIPFNDKAADIYNFTFAV